MLHCCIKLGSAFMPGATKPKVIRVFYSYAHSDELFRTELEKHLAMLLRQGVIGQWHDREIVAGRRWATSINHNLESADIILLLISPDFISSKYCYEKEMKRALQREQSGNARVIPIIVRSVDWTGAPFAHLQALPKDGKPVDSWPKSDEAWTDVAKGIRRAVGELRKSGQALTTKSWNVPHPPAGPSRRKSSRFSYDSTLTKVDHKPTALNRNGEWNRIRVMLVDDHPVLRGALKELLEAKGYEVVGEASTGEEALALAGTLQPQVILMDLEMPGIGGLAITHRIVKTFPEMHVLILSAYGLDAGEEEYVIDALTHAAGYVLKGDSIEELLAGVRTLATGKRYLSSSIARLLDLRAQRTASKSDEN
jgi:DNA-binding NarL/FixJ family response regulator